MFLFLFISSLFLGSGLTDYTVTIKHNGPVVLGANITFSASVYKDDVKQESEFLFEWRDNMHPQHRGKFTEQGHSEWIVNHSPENYKPGIYFSEVQVFKKFILDWALCYGRVSFVLEKNLVGEMELRQNGSTPIVQDYVSSATELQHIIRLHPPDSSYLIKNTTNVTTIWFVDHVLIRQSNSTNFQWNHRYNISDVSHNVMAVIIGHRNNGYFNSTAFSSSHSPESFSDYDFISSTASSADLKLNDSLVPMDKQKLSYSTFTEVSDINNLQMVEMYCSSSNNIVCGFFSRNITVKAPVDKVSIQGNGWLHDGEMLNLTLTCTGSAPFEFCVRFFFGDYNVTGNESCKFYVKRSAVCDFSVVHYFQNSTHHTVLLIVKNDINSSISKFGVDVYKVIKHPQLSVIVVPVMASILAVVLIIFGVAFYFQNNNTYAIETADFDFANNNDMEYKTFKERLIEAIHNALFKTKEFTEEDSHSEAPSTSNKNYGSMP